MNVTVKAAKVMCIVLSLAAVSACGGKSKSKSDDQDDKTTTGVVPSNKSSTNTVPARPVGGTPTSQPQTNPPVSACSTDYQISGKANPFLAGAPVGAELAYDTALNDVVSADPLLTNAPVAVVAQDTKCFDAGRRLYFEVSGKIAYNEQAEVFTDADGQSNYARPHKLKSINGLSDITAPLNSLVGVFLDETAFAARPEAPEALDFSTEADRNFRTFSPKINQIFFIGDGKDATGLLQAFIVPKGTTRLYLAIMDEYEWSNNQGQLSGNIQWVKP